MLWHFLHPNRYPENKHLKAACGNAEAGATTSTVLDVTCGGCTRTNVFKKAMWDGKSLKKERKSDHWVWVGDGSDDLDSMGSEMKVLITVEQLRELLGYMSNRRFAIERQKERNSQEE